MFGLRSTPKAKPSAPATGEKTLYLHIGTHKTATTWLQHFFNQNREALAEQGFLYSRAGLVTHAQHRLAQKIWSRENPSAPLSEIPHWQDLDEELAGNPHPNVLISSEEFEWIKSPALIAQFIKGYSVKVIIYLRRQDDYVESMYQQQVRDFSPRLSIDINQYLVQNKLAYLDYWALCERWAEAFGADNIIVRRYEKPYRVGGEMKSDLFSCLGIEDNEAFIDPHGKAMRHKQSIDLRFLEQLREFNALKLTAKQHQDVTWKLIEASQILKRTEGKPEPMRLLSLEKRQQIMEKCSRTNEKVLSKYIKDEMSSSLFPEVKDDSLIFQQNNLPDKFASTLKLAGILS